MAKLKFKICRRVGENIWYGKNITSKQASLIKTLNKKVINQKQSDYSKKLQETKKVAFFYGMHSLTNYLHSNLYSRNVDKKKSLLLTLESRLDIVLLRLNFCSTLFEARQLITHQKIRVNFNTVLAPGYILKKGDFISIIPIQLEHFNSKIKHKINGHQTLKNSPRSATVGPISHLEVNYKTFHAIFLYEPIQISFPYKMNLNLLT